MSVSFRPLILSAVVALASAPATAGDWTGAYATAYGGIFDVGGGFPEGMLGVMLGYNYDLGRAVIGAEADAMYYPSDGDYEIYARLRGGFKVTEDLLAFATYGVGNYNGTTTIYSAGGGLEYMMSDTISLRGDLEWQDTSANPFGGMAVVKAGLGWHF